MKKIIFTLLGFSLLLTSCTSDSTEVETITTANASAKISTNETTAVPNSVYTLSTYTSCSTDCITEGSNSYFEKTAQQTITWGGGTKSKTVYIKYFNTETDFKLLVLCDNEKIENLIKDGTAISPKAEADKNTWVEYSFPIDITNSCENINFDLKVAGGAGGQAVFTIDYNIVGMCTTATETTKNSAYMFGNTTFNSLNISTKWGWTNQFTDVANGTYTYDLYAGAAQNNITKGFKAGTVTLTIDGTAVTVKIDITDSKTNMTGSHVYLSDDQPTTASPGQYGNSHTLNNVKTDTYNLTYSGDGSFWIIVHADVETVN